MKRTTSVIARLTLVVAFAVTALAQEAPPKEPFKAVHLVNVTSAADVAALQATLGDYQRSRGKSGSSEHALSAVQGRGDAGGRLQLPCRIVMVRR